jgi:hypothetical protein
MLIVLLGFLALAVDVGYLYSERRRMQNAADAGALAGAREICLVPKAYGGDWRAAALDYTVTRNGAQAADITLIDRTVTVTASVTAQTFFAGLLGLHTVDVSAIAAAACGQALSACGLWPIGFDYGTWNQMSCDEVFYVWAGQNENSDPDCDIYDCDVDGDGDEDVIPMQGRAWLDFSDLVTLEHPDGCVQPGCGASELRCWILSTSGARVVLPACIAGDPGVRAGLQNAVNARSGDVVNVPLYDYTDCMGVTCPGTSIHAIDFGCVKVRVWVHSLELPRKDGANPPWKDKAIEVSVHCNPDECVTDCGNTDGYPADPSGIWAVSLVL